MDRMIESSGMMVAMSQERILILRVMIKGMELMRCLV